ncbi:MAG: DNA-binding response regulator [Geobacteraceae bacterium GWC2_55_20]|nr:response regulator transcription factor [Deltaproteobacteria bacterium]OGU03534.1 MAG: DNA-binding response regulator [Geobacteraceae bacterium GWC2_55_20]OGU22965.1 MAG: DNA-binding response regulator [Geobacteraceae bacterium GWF2_54_21]HBA72689.1 DNA-binding response regulator [Geobacter sp.]HCE69491.1 DNA-binding response regulator [Geobacter sp.]
MKILIVEDEKKVASFIKRGLEDDGYQVTVSHDGADGLKRALNGDFNLIILDNMLPKKDGVTVARELRESGNQVPVLMLTAKDTTEDIVSGLDAGSDDYLTKPFAFAELQARVRALIRRGEQDRGAEIRFADLRMDPVNHKVWRGQTEIVLTAKEYTLLAFMVRNANTVLSRANIADNVWEYPFETFTNIIDVYINYLRKKVDGKFPTKLIHTVRGQGYILKEG